MTNKLFYFFTKSKNIFFIILLILTQGCTSSIEVAANLGKKYLIPKEEKKIIQILDTVYIKIKATNIRK